jgi:hypothetical protein
MKRSRDRGTVMLTAVALVGCLTAPGVALGQSLEEQTRRPPGTSSLDDDSDRMRDAGPSTPTTNSLDDDSRDLRGRTADQNPTDSLDDGSLDGGDGDDSDGE